MVITWLYTDRPPDRPSAPQACQCLLSHFLATLGAHWLHVNVVINWQLSKQGIHWPVSLDCIAGSDVDPSRSSIFWSYPLTSYFIWNMLCLCHYGPALLLTFWYQTDLWRENSASYLKMQAGKTDTFHFSHHSHELVTLHVQFLCYDWSKFDRWVHADNLCSILRLVYFASRSWQTFVQLVMFLTVFFHWMYKMKYSCYQEYSVIHGWFVYWIFGCEMRRLSKSEIRFRMASFLFFTLLMSMLGTFSSLMFLSCIFSYLPSAVLIYSTYASRVEQMTETNN